MVRRPGGLDNNQHEIFNIQNASMIHNGNYVNYQIIVEDSINLYKAIQDYLNDYVNYLKKDNNLQKKFKKRMESLYRFKFKNL